MSDFAGLVEWFGAAEHWSGTDGVPVRLVEHLWLSAVPLALAILLALPVGLVIGHTRRFELLAVTIANLGRAIPSFAILSIAFQVVLRLWPDQAFGFLPTVAALVLLGLPPILTNAYVGVQTVDEDTVEAARGMGMREGQILARLELPLASPLIMAGIRTAAVQIVATATLAALIGGGGLGRYIIDGFAQQNIPEVLAGAVLVAGLSIVTEVAFAILERVLAPRTSSERRARREEGSFSRPEVRPA